MTDYLNPPPLTSATGLTPNSTPDDVLGVVEILTLVTDPTAHKKRLDELNNAVLEANQKIAEAKVASEKRRTAENMFAEASKIMAERKTAAAKLDARVGDLDRREKELIDREGKFDQQRRDQLADWKDRSSMLENREKVVAAQERSLELVRQKTAEDREKIERLKAEVREFHAKFAD